jgi:hypothetical protein
LFKTIRNGCIDTEELVEITMQLSLGMFVDCLRSKEGPRLLREFYERAKKAAAFVEQTLFPVLRGTQDWFELCNRLNLCAIQIRHIQHELEKIDHGQRYDVLQCTVSMSILEGHLFKGLVYTANEYLESKQEAA